MHALSLAHTHLQREREREREFANITIMKDFECNEKEKYKEIITIQKFTVTPFLRERKGKSTHRSGASSDHKNKYEKER